MRSQALPAAGAERVRVLREGHHRFSVGARQPRQFGNMVKPPHDPSTVPMPSPGAPSAPAKPRGTMRWCGSGRRSHGWRGRTNGGANGFALSEKHYSRKPAMPIEELSIKNYRALRDVRLTKLPKLAVVVGANGTGKSTLFDVFSFLKDALAENVSSAVAKRGGFRELVSRGHNGPVSITVKFRESTGRLATYRPPRRARRRLPRGVALQARSTKPIRRASGKSWNPCGSASQASRRWMRNQRRMDA